MTDPTPISRDLAEATFRIRELERTIREEISQLERWALQSINGSWSTHQVEPMRRRADELRRVLLP